MKIKNKIIYIIIGTAIFVNFILTINTKASSPNIETSDIELYKEEIEQIIPFKKLDIIKRNGKFYIAYNNIIESLEYEVIKAVEDELNVYILGQKYEEKNKISYLIKISNDTKKKNIKQIEIDEANDIILYNENIIIGGNKTNNVFITICDYKLDILNEIYLDGEEYQTCTNLNIVNDSLYVIGTKSAHTSNKHFANVGNKGETKTFIFQFDQSYSIINKCYLNEQLGDEKILDVINSNGNLCVNLKTNNGNYILELTPFLNITKKYKAKYDDFYLIKTPKTNALNYLFIVPKDNHFMVMAFNNYDYNTIIDIEGNYLSYQIIDGELIVYYCSDGYTYKKIISEYHIDYLNKLICNYYHNDELTQEHFKVDSYFEDLSFKIDNISPFYEKNTPGNYIVSYRCERQNGKIISVSTPLEVMNYANVIDNKIYPKGMRLFFFGKGYLNDELVANGTMLKKNGQNVLKIVDANQNIHEYNFTVVDEYYKNNQDINITPDFVLGRNENILIKVDENVRSVVGTSGEIGKIRLINGEKYLEITAPNTPGIANFQLVSFNLDNDQTINYNQNIIFKVTKMNPQYELYESIVDDNLNLDIKVSDDDINIEDVYIECYQNNELVYKYSTYIKNTTETIAKVIPNVEFSIYVKVKNEDGSIDTLFSYTGISSKQITLKYNIDFQIDNGKITNIKFLINIKNKYLHHQQIVLGEKSQSQLLSKYCVKNNYIVLYISLFLTIIIISLFTFVMLKIKKRKKHN